MPSSEKTARASPNGDGTKSCRKVMPPIFLRRRTADGVDPGIRGQPLRKSPLCREDVHTSQSVPIRANRPGIPAPGRVALRLSDVWRREAKGAEDAGEDAA